MKFSLRLGDTRSLTREHAWVCCSTNLVLPGFGSLLGGRWTGYPQALLCLAGFLLTTGFGLKFVIWGIQHWSELRNPEGDPLETLTAVWHGCRWALLGMGLFGVAWLWALFTNWGMLAAARPPADAGTPTPPK